MQFVRAGAAFLFVDPRFKGLPHLWVILNNPSSAFADGKVIAVSFVTARSYTDATVILQPGDHPFIRHATSVDYGGAKLWRVEMIEHEIGERRCHAEADVMRPILKRLRAGILASPRTPNFIKELCAGGLE